MNKFILFLISIVIGLSVAVLEYLFIFFLHLFTDIYLNFTYLSFFLFVPLFITYFLSRTNLITGLKDLINDHKPAKKISYLLIPYQIIMTWFSHLFGASVGKEGVAVQIGGAFGNLLGQKKDEKSRDLLSLVGMTAGFSCLFQSPLASVFFIIEITKRGYNWFNFLCSLVSSYVSFYAIRYITLFNFNIRQIPISFHIPTLYTVDTLLLSIFLGTTAGLLGILFVYLLKSMKKLFSKINKYLKIFLFNFLLGALIFFIHNSRYALTGQFIINDIFFNQHAFSYDAVLKLFLTIFSLSLMFQGGEVTPILSIGASLPFLFPLYYDNFVLLASISTCAFFASTTKTVISPILLGIYMFGIGNILFYTIAVSISRFINNYKSIYES